MMKTYCEEILVRSYQTDVNAQMKPSAILEIMQEMAGAHAEMLGIGRRYLLPQNLAWVLTRLEVRMERYPQSGETFTAETFPMPNRRWFFPRYFVFRDREGHVIGCAGSMWVLLDIDSRKMAKPDVVLPFMPDNSDLTAPMGMPATVEEASGEAAADIRTPVYTDLDMNGHVNNTRYLDWCCNALGIETLRSQMIRQFAVNYNQEILPGQSVRTELRRAGDAFSFCGFEEDRRHFDVGGLLSARA
ncbi:MAG: hypothetical protein IJ438_09100 [Clostridia bacterium]|nr:hypothetical protein [Clostridia bacterium]